jgi:hypothetical protein
MSALGLFSKGLRREELIMNKQLRSVCVGLSTLAIVHCTSFAQPAQKNSAADPTAISALKTKEQSSEKIADEWRANRKAMMKGDMTEESYVQQCSVNDDVPAIPEPKTNASAPK